MDKFESGNKLANPSEKEPGQKKITRRAFLVGGAALAGAAVVEGPNMVRKLGAWYDKHEEEKFNVNVEKEKDEVKKDIALGLESERKFHELVAQYNGLVKKSRLLNEDSEEYKGLLAEGKQLYREVRKFFVERGSLVFGPLAEANPYAKLLEKNRAAIEALATARVSYKEGVDRDDLGNRELPYWHNLAFAYLELEDQDQEQIKTKFKALFEYAKANDVKVSRVPAEDILYYLIDDNFDLSLKPTGLESLLHKHSTAWQKYPPTHNNKKLYAHYNDLSVLNIFELNRLRAVVSQLENPTFVSDIFKFRDEDLKDTSTELGGIVPLSRSGNALRVIPAEYLGNNEAYVVPNQQAIELFASAAAFHFHATKVEEAPEHHGPSGGDHAFFAPGIVFSSVNDSTILVHFYASRSFYTRDPYYKLNVTNEVVCLGEIKRTK